MKRIWILLATCSLLNVSSTFAKAPPDVQDFVLLTKEKPVLIRAHLKVHGAPLHKTWANLFEKLFHQLDRDHNGTLSTEEQTRIPPASALFRLTRDNQKKKSQKQPKLASPAGVAELMQFYQRAGAAPFRLVSSGSTYVAPVRVTTSGAANTLTSTGQSLPVRLNQSILSLLDQNGDKKISAKELSKAEPRLLSRDFDENEQLSPNEILGQPQPTNSSDVDALVVDLSSSMGAKLQTFPLLVLVDSGKPSAELAQRMFQKYNQRAPTGDIYVPEVLSQKEVGLAPKRFAQMDQNNDGRLSLKEMARLPLCPPDVEVDVELGVKDKIHLTKNAKAKRLEQPTRQFVDVGLTQLELIVGGAGTQRYAQVFSFESQTLDVMFKQLDRDMNGYLDKTEGNQNRFVREHFTTMADDKGHVYLKAMKSWYGQIQEFQQLSKGTWVTLNVREQGRGLFDLMDRNNDANLSLREMRAAVDLLRNLDRNRDQNLTLDEIPRRLQIAFSQGKPTDPLNRSFDVLFSNWDAGRFQFSDDQRKGPRWFKKMDRNRDGDVSPREFLGSKDAFEKLDLDGDGLISTSEATLFARPEK